MGGLLRIISPDVERQNRTPPGQRLVDSWPVLHYGSVPGVPVSQWRLQVSGLVKNKRELDYEEFCSLPQVEVLSDIHCVTTWSKLDNVWEGVSTQTVRDIVSLLPEARFVVVRCQGGYSTNLTAEDFFQSDVLLAVKHNHTPLTPAHGFPVRLVVPRLYFWKSAKWVTSIEFADHDQPGFWEGYGYHNRGDPWTEERHAR
jgi:DMSO/TMAO reductase YedYZ molybdopterin-dependent catalytic subunit